MRGLFLLAAARVEGIEEFGTDRDAYLASLAPWLALALVGAGVVALGGLPRTALVLLLRQLGLLLAPAVIAEAFCRLWHRTPLWARYATILNWSLWLEVALFCAVLLIGELGLLPAPLALAATLAAPLYLVAFHWFVARTALTLSHGRVALLLAANLLAAFGVIAASFYGSSSAELHRMLAPPAESTANGSDG